jgi:hypothetical protein
VNGGQNTTLTESDAEQPRVSSHGGREDITQRDECGNVGHARCNRKGCQDEAHGRDVYTLGGCFGNDIK